MARRRIADLLDLVSLTPHAGKKLREFSKGMLQRIGLAQALLNQPGLVILDEPTSPWIQSGGAWCATSSATCASRAPQFF